MVELLSTSVYHASCNSYQLHISLFICSRFAITKIDGTLGNVAGSTNDPISSTIIQWLIVCLLEWWLEQHDQVGYPSQQLSSAFAGHRIVWFHEDLFKCSTVFLTLVILLWMILLTQALNHVCLSACSIALTHKKWQDMLSSISYYISHITMNFRHWQMLVETVPKFSPCTMI